MAKDSPNYPPKGAYQVPSDAHAFFGGATANRDVKAGEWIVPNEDGTFRVEPADAFDPVPDPGIPGPSPANLVAVAPAAPAKAPAKE